jgi:hypothetical protein
MQVRIVVVALAAALALRAGAGPAAAATVRGVSFADEVAIGGRACRLNGVGVRTKLFVKVYLGALYLATPTKDAAAALAADEPKRVVMHFVHSRVGADKIREALADGFRASAAGAPTALGERIARFVASVDQDLREGEEIVLTYVPGQGTETVVRGAPRGTVEGADFMRALFGVWLGPRPADAGLKKGMLGLE